MTPLVATGAGFAAAGAGPELVDWLLWRNVAYASNPISPAEALGRGASALLPWLLATAPLWWAWWRSRPRLDPHRRRLVDGLVAFGLLPAFAGLRFFPHYFVPVGFALSLGAAPAVASWLTSPRTSRGRLFLAATALLVAGFQAANAFLYLGERRIYRETDPVYRRTAERLAADACFESSRLFVWGWSPAFYYEAGLRGARPASRFVVLVQAGLTGYVPGNLGSVRRRSPDEPEAAGADWDHLLDDLERSRATYIVDTAPAGIYRWDRYPIADYPRFEAYVREHYEPFASVDRVRLYRRRGCAVR
jgi:hypothetical protein